MKKIFSLLSVAILAGSLALSSCSSKQESQATEAETEVAATEETVETPVVSLADQTRNEEGIIVLTDGNLIKPGAKLDKLTVIDFSAVWCGPCKQFAPAFEAAAKKYGDRVNFVSVDIDKVPNMMGDFNLEPSIPTVLFIKPDGTYTSKMGTADLLPAEKFEALLDENLK